LPAARLQCAVGTNDLPSWPDQVGGQKSYVSTAATHVKNAHACGHSGLLE
jgi:hypothetical protein